jgi:hypothetical protein
MHCIANNEFETHGRIVHTDVGDATFQEKRTLVSINTWATLRELMVADKKRGTRMTPRLVRYYTLRFPITKELLVHLWRYNT